MFFYRFILCSIVYYVVSQITLYGNIFCQLDDALRSSTKFPSTDETQKSPVECSKQTPDSDVALDFWPRTTIWQRMTKIGDNSCRYNLHLQRHGPNLHGGEIRVSWVGANTKVPNWYVTGINAKITCKTGKPPKINKCVYIYIYIHTVPCESIRPPWTLRPFATFQASNIKI